MPDYDARAFLAGDESLTAQPPPSPSTARTAPSAEGADRADRTGEVSAMTGPFAGDGMTGTAGGIVPLEVALAGLCGRRAGGGALPGAGLNLTPARHLPIALGILDRRRDAVILAVAASGVWGASGLFKVLSPVPTPLAQGLLRLTASYGFPSGHALVTLVICGTLAWLLAARSPLSVRAPLMATA